MGEFTETARERNRSVPENKHQDLDELIARYYVQDSEADQDGVAGAIAKDHPGPGRSSSNVLKRIAELVKERILVKRTDVIDWKAVGYPFRYRIDVHVDQDALRIGRSYGAPPGEEPQDPVDNWRRLATYIMRELLPFVEKIPASKTVTKKKFSRNDLILENVTILLGQQADLTVTLRARDQEAVLTFVVDGLRTMRGVRMTSTSHEAWSCVDGEM